MDSLAVDFDSFSLPFVALPLRFLCLLFSSVESPAGL